jgi:glycosyltransferase involved in cell wall biosynthesis
MKQFSIIIPAYNESSALYQTVTRLKEFLERNFVHQYEYEIIVVNDGSTDRTKEILENIKNITVITHPRNKGYGASIKSGVKNAKYDWILLFDADGQHNSEYLPKIIEKSYDAEMVVGKRIGYKGPLLRQPGKKILKRVAEYLTGEKIPDINSGLRMFKKEDFNQFKHLLPDGFSLSTTLTMSFLTAGLNISYVPIKIEKRQGKSTVRPIKHGFGTILLMLRLIMLFNPLKIFLPISFFSGLLTLAFLVHDIAILNITSSTTILFLATIMIFCFGLVADQVSILRRDIKR